MGDYISRAKAIFALSTITMYKGSIPYNTAVMRIKQLPSAQPEQTEMIKEIRKWINSANRGNTDYFIVDKIEEIINRYE